MAIDVLTGGHFGSYGGDSGGRAGPGAASIVLHWVMSSVTITLRLSSDLLARVDAAALAVDLKRNSYLVQLLQSNVPVLLSESMHGQVEPSPVPDAEEVFDRARAARTLAGSVPGVVVAVDLPAVRRVHCSVCHGVLVEWSSTVRRCPNCRVNYPR
jgi:hypothetical protein